MLFPPHYVPADLSIKIAVATALACTSMSVIYAAAIYIRKSNIYLYLCLCMAGIYTVTAIVGAHTLHFPPTRVTEIILGIVLFFVAAKTMLTKNGHAW